MTRKKKLKIKFPISDDDVRCVPDLANCANCKFGRIYPEILDDSDRPDCRVSGEAIVAYGVCPNWDFDGWSYRRRLDYNFRVASAKQALLEAGDKEAKKS